MTTQDWPARRPLETLEERNARVAREVHDATRIDPLMLAGIVLVVALGAGAVQLFDAIRGWL